MSEQEIWVVEERVDGEPWLPTSEHHDEQSIAETAALNMKNEDDWRRKQLDLKGSADYRAACYRRVEAGS